MALPLGKLTILVGAGILGSVLAKEGRVSDLVSGAFKIAWKQIKRDDHTPVVKKPHSDYLMAQMDTIRHELEILASRGGPVIVTATQTGSSRYGVIIVVVVAGYGYFWWKGWKLPNMMFATRRSLSDACNSISKQLENVYTSISATKRILSSKIDGVDRSLDETIENTAATHQEVIELQGKTDSISKDFRKVQHAVLTLETKINRIEGKQDLTNEGVWRLCDYAQGLEIGRTTERIQASPSSSSRPALELPPTSPSSLVTPSKSSRSALELPPISPSRTGSLPPVLESEPRRFGSNRFQENNGISEVVETSNRREVSNGFGAPEGTSNGASSSGRFGFKFPTFNTSTILRTRSATSGMLQQTRSASQQL